MDSSPPLSLSMPVCRLSTSLSSQSIELQYLLKHLYPNVYMFISDMHGCPIPTVVRVTEEVEDIAIIIAGKVTIKVL